MVAKDPSFSVGRFIVRATPVAELSARAKSLAATPSEADFDPPPIGTPKNRFEISRWERSMGRKGRTHPSKTFGHDKPELSFRKDSHVLPQPTPRTFSLFFHLLLTRKIVPIQILNFRAFLLDEFPPLPRHLPQFLHHRRMTRLWI